MMHKSRISSVLFLLFLLYFLLMILIYEFLHQYTSSTNNQKCPEMPAGLKGKQKIQQMFPTMEELEEKHPEVGMGGWWNPKECSTQQRVAIIIPFRNRSEHLRGFLYHIHDFLQHQQADYRIFVINQAYPQGKTWDKFNRAKLLNAGFLEVHKMNFFPVFDCFIFHDVDLVPENEHNLYRCNLSYPKRFIWSRHVGTWKMSETSFGGIVGLTPKQYENINGFSNYFWGWGWEDNDLSKRILEGPNYKNYESVHEEKATYLDLKRASDFDATNPWNTGSCVEKLIGTTLDRMFTDGLNTVAQSYKMVNVEMQKLYTNISLDLMYLESINSTDYPCHHLI